LAPRLVALATVSSTSSVPMYGRQCGVSSRDSIDAPSGPLAAANIE
jgi:hypothetical protein